MEPEPDVSVVQGTERDYIGTGHPTTAMLIVEVSDTTLRYDRGTKASLYAKHGIADYWIVNLEDGRVEVHRQPVADAKARFRMRYDNVTIHQKGEFVAPLAMPAARVAVSDLLP